VGVNTARVGACATGVVGYFFGIAPGELLVLTLGAPGDSLCGKRGRRGVNPSFPIFELVRRLRGPCISLSRSPGSGRR
jgi:hypothetical protein